MEVQVMPKICYLNGKYGAGRMKCSHCDSELEFAVPKKYKNPRGEESVSWSGKVDGEIILKNGTYINLYVGPYGFSLYYTEPKEGKTNEMVQDVFPGSSEKSPDEKVPF